MTNEHDFLRLEAIALAYVLREQQADKRRQLLDSTPWLHLAPLAQACNDDHLQHGDVTAVLNRLVLRKVRDELQRAQLLEVLTGPLDPQHGEHSLANFIEASQKNAWRERARMHHQRLGEVLETGNRDAVAEVVADFRRLDVADKRGDADLAALWNEHRQRQAEVVCSDEHGVRLDKRRGELARWLNSKLGPRGALEPGRTMLIGGAPGAGKTTLGSMLAVDALTVGCPVLVWQMELSRAEQLEHLVGQVVSKGGNRWLNWRDALKAPLPNDWQEMLRIPPLDDPNAATVERLTAAVRDLAGWSEQQRKAGYVPHACNGLVLVDYVQLLTMADRGPRDAQHDVLTTILSRLTKLTAEAGMVLVALSQFTKGAQGAGDAGGGTMTSFAGADLARMAHVAVTLTRADRQGQSTSDAAKEHRDETHGWARNLAAVKTRGESEHRGQKLSLWTKERTFHTATADKATNTGSML